MFVHLYQRVFSAETFAHHPADRVAVDDEGEPPLLVPLFTVVMHYKFMVSLNTNPNTQFRLLILYLSKPMIQTPNLKSLI